MIRFGIDFGGVIVKQLVLKHDNDTALTGSENINVALPGVFEAIKKIVSICDGQVWIVSKAGPSMQVLTKNWLEAVDFFSRTGMRADHVRFCLEREDKRGICRELEISHFVDDRIHIMQILRHTVPNLYLFGEEGKEHLCPPWSTFVCTWNQILELLLSSQE